MKKKKYEWVKAVGFGATVKDKDISKNIKEVALSLNIGERSVTKFLKKPAKLNGVDYKHLKKLVINKMMKKKSCWRTDCVEEMILAVLEEKKIHYYFNLKNGKRHKIRIFHTGVEYISNYISEKQLRKELKIPMKDTTLETPITSLANT